MTGPQIDEKYSEAEQLQMMTSARLSQSITIAAADVTVTLQNPSSIVNADNQGRIIYYQLIDDAAMISEYFNAGEEKLRRPITIGGSDTGTASVKVIVLQS